ncbi:MULTISPECIES: DUF1392 family protein [unclassified Nostoc]|uniref:DUF1392 family protein n=1 Tax=unclassified Nostoc TaxID=2593658 RepID=UPI001DC401B5|nr:DUF1392 family protein [Nostoc sp. JL23]MBN3875607.1 DUF1392 family protein [Nostoc sp. JL23]
MINQITALESCWHISPWWGKEMHPLAVRMLEKVLLPISDLSGYCCGVEWSGQEWIYAIVCQNETLYLAEQEFHTTNVLEKSTVSTPAFRLGDIVEVDFGERPTRRIIQGIFSLKDNWLYGVEWRSPTLEEVSTQSRTIWLADVDLVNVSV